MSQKKSVAQSRLLSRADSPQVPNDYNSDEVISPLLSTQLREKLASLSTDDSNSGHSFKRNRYVHSVEVLSEDRRKVSILSREQALAILLTDMATKYDPSLITFKLFESVAQAVETARSETEKCTAVQLVAVAITLVEGNEDDPLIGDCFDIVNELIKKLLKLAEGSESAHERATLVTAYSVLTYFVNVGGGGFGIEQFVDELLEVAEQTSGDKFAPVASAALAGAALLLTLCPKGTVSEISSNWLVSMPAMLQTSNLGPKLACVKLIAVIFERSDSEVFSEDEDTITEILDELESIAQMSIAKTGKKDKRAQSGLVKTVLKFGKSVINGDEEGLENSASQIHKHSLSKGLGVDTWSALMVAEHLNWVFGPGLHTQLANNPYIKSLLKQEDVKIEATGVPVEQISTNSKFADEPKKKLTGQKQAQQIRKLKLEKAENLGMI